MAEARALPGEVADGARLRARTQRTHLVHGPPSPYNDSVAGSRAPALADGTKLGAHTVVRELGTRRMATYAALRLRDDGASELVVMERLPRGDGGDEARRDLVRTAKLVSGLAHPNVVRVRAVEERLDEIVVVSEFVDAERYDVVTAAASKAGRPLKLTLHLRVLVDVLGALAALHTQKDETNATARLFHGEVCPANVLLALDGTARLAHVCRSRGGRNAPEAVGYVAPEVRLGDADAEPSERADVYGCGVILWEALTGKRLFPGDNDARILPRQVADKLDLAHAPADLAWAEPLGAVAARALRADPAARYPSAAEMAAEVRKITGARLPLKSALAAAVKELAAEKIAERRRALSNPSPRVRRMPQMMPTPAGAIPSDVLARALVDAAPEASSERASITEPTTKERAREANAAQAIGAEMLLNATVGPRALDEETTAPVAVPRKPPPAPPAKPRLPASAARATPTPAIAVPVAAPIEEVAVPIADDEITVFAPTRTEELARAEAKIELAVDLTRTTPTATAAPPRRPSMPDATMIVSAVATESPSLPPPMAPSRRRSRRIAFMVLAAMVLLLAAAGLRVATREPSADALPTPTAGTGGGAAGATTAAADIPAAPPPVPIPAPPSTNVATPEPTPSVAATATATAAATSTGAPPARPIAPKPKKPYDPLGI